MNKTITFSDALSAAIINLDIGSNNPRCISNIFNGEYYEICIQTCVLQYELYIDATNGEILGISTEPVLDIEAYENRQAA